MVMRSSISSLSSHLIVATQYYHEVGRVTSAWGSPERIAALRESYDSGVRQGWGKNYQWLDSAEQIKEKIPQLEGAKIEVTKVSVPRR